MIMCDGWECIVVRGILLSRGVSIFLVVVDLLLDWGGCVRRLSMYLVVRILFFVYRGSSLVFGLFVVRVYYWGFECGGGGCF